MISYTTTHRHANRPVLSAAYLASIGHEAQIFPRLWCHMKMDQTDGSTFSTHPFVLKIRPKNTNNNIFSLNAGQLANIFQLVYSQAGRRWPYFCSHWFTCWWHENVERHRRRYRIVAIIFHEFSLSWAHITIRNNYIQQRERETLAQAKPHRYKRTSTCTISVVMMLKHILYTNSNTLRRNYRTQLNKHRIQIYRLRGMLKSGHWTRTVVMRSFPIFMNEYKNAPLIFGILAGPSHVGVVRPLGQLVFL